MAKAAPVGRPKVLAVASGGGHWIQLQRVASAFEGTDLVFVGVHRDYRQEVPGHRMHVVDDANRWNRLGVAKLALQMLGVVLRERPDVVFSTGAAPGVFALLFGRLLGARTIWLDSLANVERPSLSARIVRPFAQLWLTQWPELARPEGPEYAGRVF